MQEHAPTITRSAEKVKRSGGSKKSDKPTLAVDFNQSID
jgi:hypothetical protein